MNKHARTNDLAGWRLRLAAAHATGCVDYLTFNPVALFVHVARVMERIEEGKFRVHIKTGRKSAGQTEYIAGVADCPFDACMRAVINRRHVLASNSTPVDTLPQEPNRGE